MGSEQDKNLADILGFDPSVDETSPNEATTSKKKTIESPQYPRQMQRYFQEVKSRNVAKNRWSDVRFEPEKLFCALRQEEKVVLREYCTQDINVEDDIHYDAFPAMQSVSFRYENGSWRPQDIQFDNELTSSMQDMITVRLRENYSALFYWIHEPLHNFTVVYKDNLLEGTEMNDENGQHDKPLREDSNGTAKISKKGSTLFVPTTIDSKDLLAKVFGDDRLLTNPFTAPSEADNSWRFMNAFELFQADWKP